MKKPIILLLLVLFSFDLFGQEVDPKINYFSVSDYGKAHESANWAVVQDTSGILYFGNAGGLIQYDGRNWNFIKIKDQSSWIKALAVSDQNVVYLGAQNEFGYLSPDKSGKQSYISLSDQLNDSLRNFNNIARVWTWDDKVVFQSENRIFIYNGKTISTITPETSFHLSFLVDNEIFVRERGIGLMKLSGNELQFVKGSEFLKNTGVCVFVNSSDPRKYILLSREDGFWKVDKTSFQAVPVSGGDTDFLKKAGVYGGVALSGGRIALNTLYEGILIIDEDFTILNRINKDKGLKVNGVLCLTKDFQGNLWAGLDNGIVQVWDNSPVSTYGKQSGISGNINSLVRYSGRLTVGTTDGLFIQNQSLEAGNPFKIFPGFVKDVRALCIADKQLIAGTQNGLFSLEGAKVERINDEVVSALYFSRKLGILFVGGSNRIQLYHFKGKWEKIGEIEGLQDDIVRIEEEQDSPVIWLGGSHNGVIRMIFSDSRNLKYALDRFDSFDGLAENSWTIPLSFNGKTIFATRTGLMQFIDENSLRMQLPDSLKNRPEFSRGYFDYLFIDSIQDKAGFPIYNLAESKSRIYANRDGELGFYNKQKNNEWESKAFVLSDVGKVNVFFYEDNGICWIGGDDGLIRFDENVDKNYDLQFNAIISRVSCNNDSVLWNGYDGLTPKDGPKGISLNYSQNSLEFQFAAPFYEGQDKILFSARLEGRDKNYSDWVPENKLFCSNLHEGDYTLRVKAKNAYGTESKECTYRFTIRAPWYRTFGAYLLYILIFILITFIGIRINSWRLIEKNRKLEEIILERTHEIETKNKILVKQKQEILDSINYAQRIQKAVLPDDDLSSSWLGEHFIFFRPKDIVSGDFYWATLSGNRLYFCVADCTGHGVPGAFMSMLSISLLNEVVLTEGFTDSGKILNRLRELIIESLRQKGIPGEQKDGMDISLCILDRDKSELQFSGANNPLYIVRNRSKEAIPSHRQLDKDEHVLYELKGDSMPIAIYVKMEDFKTQHVKVLKGDRIFLFSDGIADQFGGPANEGGGKKFMSKSLKNALLDSCQLSMEQQKQAIEDQINAWMAYTDPTTGEAFEQVDDICLMGVEI
ncbi:MAG: SpoIIE family protein phosphatase [Bacteroidales bacterium]|nr:SpoIIE family protein phosphatase [Bacteroidales bacterium]